MSITIITTRNASEIVRINEESLGTVYPRAVLPNAGLKRVGTVNPRVIRNQLTGQEKCAQRTYRSLVVLSQKDIPGVKR